MNRINQCRISIKLNKHLAVENVSQRMRRRPPHRSKLAKASDKENKTIQMRRAKREEQFPHRHSNHIESTKPIAAAYQTALVEVATNGGSIITLPTGNFHKFIKHIEVFSSSA